MSEGRHTGYVNGILSRKSILFYAVLPADELKNTSFIQYEVTDT